MKFDKQILVKKGGFQAIVLEEEQFYYGRLTILDDSFKLEKVYTFGEKLDEDGAPQLKSAAHELYAPESMIVDRRRILRWYNLKDDSAIALAITKHLAETT